MGQVAKSMRQGLETKPFNTRLMAELFGGIFDEGVYRKNLEFSNERTA